MVLFLNKRNVYVCVRLCVCVHVLACHFLVILSLPSVYSSSFLSYLLHYSIFLLLSFLCCFYPVNHLLNLSALSIFWSSPSFSTAKPWLSLSLSFYHEYAPNEQKIASVRDNSWRETGPQFGSFCLDLVKSWNQTN